MKDHPALYIYFHGDEPPASMFEGLAADSRIVRSIDPNHPTWVNLLPTYAGNKKLGLEGDTISAYREHVRLFLETYDPAFVSYDPTRLMVVNLDYRKERSLEIMAPFDVARFDPDTGTWMPLGKKFTLDLAKGEGTLLLVDNLPHRQE